MFHTCIKSIKLYEGFMSESLENENRGVCHRIRYYIGKHKEDLSIEFFYCQDRVL